MTNQSVASWRQLQPVNRALMHLLRRWRRRALPLVLVTVLLPPALIFYVHLTTSSMRYTHAVSVPRQRVAVVFGAGVRPDGRPSRVLADRVRAAVQLYQQGRVQKLLMTGDNSRDDYNEVAAMQHYAEELGVPAANITLDYAGFSTYESCYRARDIFGVKQAVLVTQHYHLPRAVYTCRHLNVDAVGLGIPYWDEGHPARHIPPFLRRHQWREWLATLNALVQVHITHPRPTFLGPFEGI
jgi:vancomycin permeability regulator SanA